METLLLGALSAFLRSPTAVGAFVLAIVAGLYGIIRGAIALGRLADTGRDLLAEVRALPPKLQEHHDQTRGAIVAIDRRVEELARTLTAAVGADGDLTRQALQDKRLSELTAATERTERAAEEARAAAEAAAADEVAAPPPVVPARRQRQPSQPGVRTG